MAEALLMISPEVKERLFRGQLPKGDALGVARIAAIMAAKQTSSLVPLCHPIPIDGVDVAVEETDDGARIEVTARTSAKTGIEMEAMTAAAIGAVALYDMIKGLDRGAMISSVRLLHKSGGKSGEWNR
jgi:cyclic pyranopterin phosphate synthase